LFKADPGTRLGLAVLQTLAVTLSGTWLLQRLGLAIATAATAAYIAGSIVPVFSSYVMHKPWTFSQRGST